MRARARAAQSVRVRHAFVRICLPSREGIANAPYYVVNAPPTSGNQNFSGFAPILALSIFLFCYACVVLRSGNAICANVALEGERFFPKCEHPVITSHELTSHFQKNGSPANRSACCVPIHRIQERNFRISQKLEYLLTGISQGLGST